MIKIFKKIALPLITAGMLFSSSTALGAFGDPIFGDTSGRAWALPFDGTTNLTRAEQQAAIDGLSTSTIMWQMATYEDVVGLIIEVFDPAVGIGNNNGMVDPGEFLEMLTVFGFFNFDQSVARLATSPQAPNSELAWIGYDGSFYTPTGDFGTSQTSDFGPIPNDIAAPILGVFYYATIVETSEPGTIALFAGLLAAIAVMRHKKA